MYAKKKKKEKCPYKKPLGRICGLFETSAISQINSPSSVVPPLLYVETCARRFRVEGWRLSTEIILNA